MKALVCLNSLYVISLPFLLVASGCLSPSDIVDPAQTTPNSEVEVIPDDGEMAVLFVFSTSSTTGSFDTPTTSTIPAAGSGHKPQRIFRPNGDLIASEGTDDDSWPDWISSMEVGISGTNNTSATHQDCFRFADSSDQLAKCDLDADSTKDEACGAKQGFLRVSELDCNSATIVDGNGGATDGVYIRLTLDRDELADYENLMLVLEYEASGLNSAPSAPLNCFNGTEYDPTSSNCSDMSWQFFIKHSASDVVKPFMTFVPPVLGFVDTSNETTGSQKATREFYVPLRSDSNISVLQFSRITSIPIGATNFTARCGANSARCVGMVFHSMAVYRM